MDLNVKFNGLDEVNELIEQVEKQVKELHTTTAQLRVALSGLGIEISQSPIDPPTD